jgi:prepilin-type N-terminal cleavage/methylation domain-containing protein
MIRTHKSTRAHRRAYTLLEIMFAILILGVGMAAVASLFPFAAHIQQSTMFEVENQQTQANIVALVQARGFSRAKLDTAVSFEVSGAIYPTETNKLTTVEMDLAFTLKDRSYPSDIGDDADTDGVLDGGYERRSIFWEPLFVKQANGQWRIMVVIMRRRAKGVVPTLNIVSVTKQAAGPNRDYNFEADTWITSTAANLHKFRVGDKVIDHEGNTHDVLDIAYDDAGGAGQNSDPFAVKLSGSLASSATWKFWHINQNGVTHSGEILDVLVLGEEILR